MRPQVKRPPGHPHRQPPPRLGRRHPRARLRRQPQPPLALQHKARVAAGFGQGPVDDLVADQVAGLVGGPAHRAVHPCAAASAASLTPAHRPLARFARALRPRLPQRRQQPLHLRPLRQLQRPVVHLSRHTPARPNHHRARRKHRPVHPAFHHHLGRTDVALNHPFRPYEQRPLPIHRHTDRSPHRPVHTHRPRERHLPLYQQRTPYERAYPHLRRTVGFAVAEHAYCSLLQGKGEANGRF